LPPRSPDKLTGEKTKYAVAEFQQTLISLKTASCNEISCALVIRLDGI
jgi:hypothetical protein